MPFVTFLPVTMNVNNNKVAQVHRVGIVAQMKILLVHLSKVKN